MADEPGDAGDGAVYSPEIDALAKRIFSVVYPGWWDRAVAMDVMQDFRMRADDARKQASVLLGDGWRMTNGDEAAELDRLRAVESRVRAEIAEKEECAAKLPAETQMRFSGRREVLPTGRINEYARRMNRDADDLREKYLGESRVWSPSGEPRPTES